MTSHEYAKKMQELSEFLLARPEFKTDQEPYVFFHYYDRDSVVAAVRALGNGTKEFQSNELVFKATGIPEHCQVRVYCPRDKVCKLVEPAKYDCEPLLSPEEVEAL